MGVSVAFNYASWVSIFPEFAQTVNPDLAAELFTVATQLHANDGSGPVESTALQTTALNLVMAHLAMLFYGTAASPPTQLVGRISNATEGSVSVQTEYAVPPSHSRPFWDQTKYGAVYWQMTGAFRIFKYRRGPRRTFNPFRVSVR